MSRPRCLMLLKKYLVQMVLVIGEVLVISWQYTILHNTIWQTRLRWYSKKWSSPIIINITGCPSSDLYNTEVRIGVSLHQKIDYITEGVQTWLQQSCHIDQWTIFISRLLMYMTMLAWDCLTKTIEFFLFNAVLALFSNPTQTPLHPRLA